MSVLEIVFIPRDATKQTTEEVRNTIQTLFEQYPGHWHVQQFPRSEEEGPPVYASVKDLNDGLRALALRTLNVLSGLGLSKTTPLYEEWERFAQRDALVDSIDEEILAKYKQLDKLRNTLATVQDLFDGAKSFQQDMDRALIDIDKIEPPKVTSR